MVKYREPALGESNISLTSYTSSMNYDNEIADYVILVTLAHVYHLYMRGYIPKTEANKLIKNLQELYTNESVKSKLLAEKQFEDIFEALEDFLEKQVGSSIYNMPLGRSRNDHVVAAIKLKIFSETATLVEILYKELKKLIDIASNSLDTPFIIHTHTMPAQATSYAHYLASIIEELIDVLELIINDTKIYMKSPLGSGAGAGTSAEIDRDELAFLLGFLGISENTLYSTSSRIFLDALMRSLYMISIVLSRVANDYILFTHNSIGIISPPLDHVQTSSIMPQKRNPATLEIARARLKKIVSNSFYLGIVESGLPTGYSLDLQELTPVVWESIRICKEAINVVFDFINKAKVNEEKVVELIEKGGVLATEIAEALSITKGIPYRLAHQKVASSLRKTNWDLARAVELIVKEENVELTKLVDWKKALTAKKVKGSPNPEFVKKNLLSLNERLDKLFFDFMQIKEKFSISVTNLLNIKVYE